MLCNYAKCFWKSDSTKCYQHRQHNIQDSWNYMKLSPLNCVVSSVYVKWGIFLFSFWSTAFCMPIVMMGLWQPVTNLRDYVSQNPPGVTFFLCLLALAISFICLSSYSYTHTLPNPDTGKVSVYLSKLLLEIVNVLVWNRFYLNIQ